MPYLVIEYIEGGNLRKLIGKASREKLLKILIKVAEIIMRIHNLGIYHLDLKPENILLRENGEPVITDFGFAKFKANTYRYSSGIWGTLVYTAPEVWNGEYSDKSDVYSLGIILTEILAGKPYGRNIKNPKLKELVEKATSQDHCKDQQ